MSTYRNGTGSSAVWILSFVVLATLAGGARAMTISPSPSYTGSYTVSFAWTGCYQDSSQFPYRSCQFLEERTQSGAWATVLTAQGATSWSASGKTAGTYTYEVYKTYGFGDKQIVDGPVSVPVGTPPPRDPLLTQLSYQFRVRQGDINADGRTDLFVERVSGGVARNGVLDAAILRQSGSGGSFSAAAPAVYESSLASSWPLSSVSVVVSDFNVDGFVDVEVKGVAAATGASGALDQIVFSSGVPLQAQPLGVRAVDASLKQFVGNLLDYIVNPNYFDENASVQYVTETIPYFWCDWNSPYFGIWDGWHHGMPPCEFGYIYRVGYYPDYSAFSSAAVAVWNDELAHEAGIIDSSQSTANAQQAAEAVLQVQIGGWPMEEILGATGEHTDSNVRRGLETFWAILGIGRANAQEVETAEAPPQVPRVLDNVYITGRRALGVVPAHTAIEYVDPLVTRVWISAFGEFVGGNLRLVAYERHPADAPHLNATLGTVQEPGNRNALYFAELRNARRNYDNDLCYALTPVSSSPCYNSNGFTSGVIVATGGHSSIDLSIFPGGAHPVPAGAFQ
jgi:hypothetical protein